MQHKSFFTRPVDPDDLIALARAADPDLFVRGNTKSCPPLTHSARTGALGPDGLGYFDGAAANMPGLDAGAIITHAEASEACTAALVIVSQHPRTVFIGMMNALLAENPVDYTRTTDGLSAHVSVGDNQIEQGAIVMPGSRIGRGCVIETGAIIRPGVILEDGVHVKTGAILGSSGAAISVTEGATLSQPHLGTLVIGAGTEIGSQANMVRGIFGATTIGQRCVIGNQVNIGHNCTVGHGVWLGAGAIIGGYSQIGDFTNIGMGTKCRNGLKIGNGCNVAMGSCLMKDLLDGQSCIGNPAKPTAFRLSAGPAVPFPLERD